MSKRIYQMKDHYISVDQDIYDTSIVDKYLYVAKVKTSTTFYETTLPSDMIFTKVYASTNDEKVKEVTREFNIHYRALLDNLFICYLTWFSPRCHLRSHSSVCIKNHSFIVGIGPILNKELECIFRSYCSNRTCAYS